MKRNIGINKKKPSIKVIPPERQSLKQLRETLKAYKLPSFPGTKADREKIEDLIARKIAQQGAKKADKKYEAQKSKYQAAKAGFNRPR
jgi:hypothetical protein